MGCFSSKEKSFRLVDDVLEKSSTLSPANSRRHGLIISGLDSNKFLPLVRKPRNTSISKRAMFSSRSTDVPTADVKCVTGLNLAAGAVRPDNIISASKPPLQRVILPEVDDDTSEEFSFSETGNDSEERINFPMKVLKSVRITPSSTQELPIEQVSIYSPSTYVTPRFGSYGRHCDQSSSSSSSSSQ